MNLSGDSCTGISLRTFGSTSRAQAVPVGYWSAGANRRCRVGNCAGSQRARGGGCEGSAVGSYVPMDWISNWQSQIYVAINVTARVRLTRLACILCCNSETHAHTWEYFASVCRNSVGWNKYIKNAPSRPNPRDCTIERVLSLTAGTRQIHIGTPTK